MKSLSYIHEDHAITYIYGRRCNSAERGFRDTTCTCKKTIHPIEIENHAKVFFRSFNNAPFQVSGINITKNVYRTKNLYTFLKNFFSCNAQNQNISYNKKNHHL